MPRFNFAPSCHVEETYSLPSIHLENFYAEEAPDRPDWGYRLVPTPGLFGFTVSGTGTKGRGCTQTDAVSAADIIAVYATQVVRINPSGVETLLTGAVTDDNLPVAWGASQTQLVLNSGGASYTVTGTTVTNFTANLTSAGMGGTVTDVATIDSRHLYSESASGRVFYSDPGDATTIDGFFTAESDPDFNVGLLVVGSNIIVLGRKRSEFWVSTGSDTTPFIARSGYVYEYGLMSPRARGQVGGVGYWVAHDGKVVRWAGGIETISEPWLERMLVDLNAANKALVRLTAHSWTGHEFAKVYVPGKGSFFYDARTRKWHRRRDLGDAGVTDWGYDYFVEANGRTYCQRMSNGKIVRLSASARLEDGETVRRVLTALIPIDSPQRVNNLIIEGQGGVGLPGQSGELGNPECMLRASYDGHTFGDELRAPLGLDGQFRWRPVFGTLGTFLPPIAKIELAYSAPVSWTVYGATYNERAY